MIINEQKHILIAPLDWGLGHTTRSITIMRYLLSLGHLVSFAGNEWQRDYINKTFPGIETIHLEGYDVTYSEKGSGFLLTLMRQFPDLIKTIRKENYWLMQLTTQQHFDAIITDNRYGLYHPSIPCVMMTHQLLAKTGMGNFADHLLKKIHYKYIQKFNTCWVIDVEGKPNLSGSLGHPDVIPNNAKYIGLLSQMEEESLDKRSENHLLILLSGPEPQRTILSKILWKQAQQYRNKIVFVEGSNKVQEPENIPAHISYYKQITKEILSPLINDASIIICRSGYSTLMDLVALDKKAILIPTPGQTEQEYLGKFLHDAGVFYSVPQKNFDLKNALNEASSFPFKKLALENPLMQYRDVIDEWVKKLR